MLELCIIIDTFRLTLPCSLTISPRRAERSDDFPEPTSPTTATRLPGFIDKLILDMDLKYIKKCMLIRCTTWYQSDQSISNNIFWQNSNFENVDDLKTDSISLMGYME